MPYGKALGTYRRINNIKRSTEKISRARNMINEQRARAINEMRELEADRRVHSSIAQGLAQGASIGMSLGGVDPDDSGIIAAGVHGVASLASRITAGGLSDDAIMGLGREGMIQYQERDQYNPFEDAMSGHAFQEALDDNLREERINRALRREEWDDDFGLDKDQMRETARYDRSFTDWERLPERTLERLYNIGVSQGHFEPIPDDETNRLEAMRSRYFRAAGRKPVE